MSELKGPSSSPAFASRGCPVSPDSFPSMGGGGGQKTNRHPDPLFETPSLDLKANMAPNRCGWTSRCPPTRACRHVQGTLSLKSGRRHTRRISTSDLTVLGFALPPGSNQDHFYLKTPDDPGSVPACTRLFARRWSRCTWKLLEKYVRNWAEHSQDAITVFLHRGFSVVEGDTGFPVAGVVHWKFAGAWESMSRAQFEFDYSDFDRFVEMCLAGRHPSEPARHWSRETCLTTTIQWLHYQDTAAGQVRKLKSYGRNTGLRERVWSQFAKSFQDHLREKGWLGFTTVGLDEISTADLDRIVPVFSQSSARTEADGQRWRREGKVQTDFSPEMAFHFGYVKSEVPLPDTVARRAQGKRTLMYTANTPVTSEHLPLLQTYGEPDAAWLVWKIRF